MTYNPGLMEITKKKELQTTSVTREFSSNFSNIQRVKKPCSSNCVNKMKRKNVEQYPFMQKKTEWEIAQGNVQLMSREKTAQNIYDTNCNIA